MENQRHSEAPVNLGALLIGEKTVPKGCRVMHVSSHGMLLQCDSDGRPRTFSKGDSVDIHLTVRHNGEQKKLTIPSLIRHVSESSLDVEFQHPDPVLLDLIESYRISDTHRLEAAVSDTQTDLPRPAVIPIPGKRPPGKEEARTAPAAAVAGKRIRPVPVLALLAGLAVLLVTGIYYVTRLQQQVNTLETLVDDRDKRFDDIENRLFSASLLEGRYASLDARISALGDAVVRLEHRIRQPAASGTDRDGREEIPQAAGPAAAVTPATETPATAMHPDEPAEQPAVAVSRSIPSAPAAETEKPVAAGTRQGDAGDEPATAAKPSRATGPWTINLMSSVDRQDLDRIARLADDKGIRTRITSREVKGRTYWRLQVTGFDSLAEAKAGAGDIKQALGIEEVWFLKRKPGS